MDLLTDLAVAILSFVILIVLTVCNLKIAASLMSGRLRKVGMSKTKDDENDFLEELSSELPPYK